MKVICIKQFYPQDDFGGGPNDYALVLTPDHFYYADVKNWWEEPRPYMDSYDYETKDNKIYEFCFNKLYDFFESADNDADEDDIFSFEVYSGEFPDDNINKLNFTKESVCMNFVEEKVTKWCNISTKENNDVRLYLTYLCKYDEHDITLLLNDYDETEEEDQYQDLCKKNLEKMIIEKMDNKSLSAI